MNPVRRCIHCPHPDGEILVEYKVHQVSLFYIDIEIVEVFHLSEGTRVKLDPTWKELQDYISQIKEQHR